MKKDCGGVMHNYIFHRRIAMKRIRYGFLLLVTGIMVALGGVVICRATLGRLKIIRFPTITS
jgi:hypothetical protein